MTRNRLLVLHTSWGFGGAEKQAGWLAQELAGRGWDVAVRTLLESDLSSAEQSAMPGRALDPGPPLLARGLLSGLQTLRRNHVDVVVTFLFHPTLFARLAKLVGARWKLISSARSTSFGSGARHRAWRWSSALDDVVTANYVGAASLLGISRPVEFVPNVVDPPVSVAARRRELPDAVRLLYVGSMRPAKRVDLVLDAAAVFVKRHSSVIVNLTLIGSGPEADSLMRRAELVRSPRLRIDFMGNRPAGTVREAMAGQDLLISTSAWEGSPNVLLEAMASGLPYVATAVGDVPRLHGLSRRNAGRLLPPRPTAEAIAEAMDEVLGEYETFADAAAEFVPVVLRTHGARPVADRWETLLREAACD